MKEKIWKEGERRKGKGKVGKKEMEFELCLPEARSGAAKICES